MAIDTTRITHLAVEVGDLADALAREAEQLRRRVDAVPWQGRAAEAFRGAASQHLDILAGATAQAHDAARALAEHAALVDRRRAELVQAAELLAAGTLGLGGVVSAVL